MKNYFLTELPSGKLNFGTNLRAVETWMKLLDAENINIIDFFNAKSQTKREGICWLIIPKGEDQITTLANRIPNMVEFVKQCFDKVYCIQEGETTFFQRYSVKTQSWLHKQFAASDRIYTQNEYDKKYYKGLHTNEVKIIRTMLDPSVLEASNFLEKEDAIILPGPMMTEYCGLEKSIVSKEFGNCRIDIPPMGTSRMPKDSFSSADSVGVNYLEYTLWKQWMENLSRYKLGYFLVQAIGAASFPLNCAYHGIPCIGDSRADTQRILFPDLSIDYLDLEKAKDLTKKLWIDQEFYLYCSNKAKTQYAKEFNRNRFYQLLEK